MRHKKVTAVLLSAAIVLSATWFFPGCSTAKKAQAEPDTAKTARTDPDTAEEESSREYGSEKESVTEDQRENDTTEESNPTDQTKTPEIDIYDDVLAEYRDMVQNDFYMLLRDSDTYDSSFGEHIGLEIRTHRQDIYYAFYDIDKNGTMELLIAGGENGVSNPSFSPWNYDLYSYDGTKVVSVFPEMEFGYRTNFALYENGVIEVFYSGSAAESGVDFYKISSDGFTVELIDSFSAVGHLEKEEPVFTYSQNGTEITEEEYLSNIQYYEVSLAESINWIQIQ